MFNRGYGGYNSRWCAREDVLDGAFAADARREGRTFLATVMLGTNDATRMRDATAERTNRVRVELEEYAKNMRTIIARAVETSEIVVAMTPPAVDERRRVEAQRERWGEDWVGGPFEDHRPDVEAYGKALVDVVREFQERRHRVYALDLYAETRAAMERGAVLFEDGVHFGEDGQRFVTEKLFQVLDSLDADPSVPDFPYGHEIRNPERAAMSAEEVFDDHEARRPKEALEP